jgi:FdhD protein
VTGPTLVTVVDGSTTTRRPDRLAVEAPLEIRVESPTGSTTLGVTMRTPGADAELVAGLLHAEGIIAEATDLWRVRIGGSAPGAGGAEPYAVATAILRRSPRRAVRPRAVATSSACGVCGTAALDGLDVAPVPVPDGAAVDPVWLCELPGQLRAGQQLFDGTGTVHGAGLAPVGGRLEVLREDVGRHNAVDKVIGWALLHQRLPVDGALVVSGRVSYEIVQKAARAAIPVVVAVSGATSLAVELAAAANITLAGFVRDGRATIYSGVGRLGGRAADTEIAPVAMSRGRAL